MPNEKKENIESVEDDKYTVAVRALENKYKDKLKVLVTTMQGQISKECLKLLGEPFIRLIAERNELIKLFKENSRELFVLAIKHGMKEEVEHLVKSINSTVEDKEIGQKRFSDIINEMAKYDASLCEKVVLSKERLKKNKTSIYQLIENNKPKLQKIEEEYREKLKNVIVSLILEYDEDIEIIKTEMRVSSKTSDYTFLKEANVDAFNAEEVVEKDETILISILNSNNDVN